MRRALALVLVLGGCDADDGGVSAAVRASECDGCHGDAYDGARFDHASVGYGRACADCHHEIDWVPRVRPDHDAFFPLVEAHATLACGECHRAERAGQDGSACVGCHAADRDAARPSHGGFPDDCLLCHTAAAWRPSTFADHDRFFPLQGRHATLDCASCHLDGVYAGTPRLCVGCHAADRDAAQTSHAGFPDDCAACHGQDAWRPASLPDHDRFFPLEGRHAELECASCHLDGVYAGTPRLCVECHAADRDGAAMPHTGFPDDCTRCHSQVAWQPAWLPDHDRYFPLDGAHARLACESCHAGGRYAGTPTACAGCHADDRDRARPDHTGFPAACDRCHTTAAWRPPVDGFHDAFYPLTGVHANLDCARCHEGGRYAGTPSTCGGCHAAERAAAVPDHTGFSEDCSECHTADAWRPVPPGWHDAFHPLRGRHAALECVDCHAGGRYAGTPQLCVGCHAADRAGAAVAHGGFPDDCAACHSEDAWLPAGYTHRFRVPHHGVRDCVSCHPDRADFATFVCIDCHEHRRGEVDPEHREVRGYRYESVACLECHPRG